MSLTNEILRNRLRVVGKKRFICDMAVFCLLFAISRHVFHRLFATKNTTPSCVPRNWGKTDTATPTNRH